MDIKIYYEPKPNDSINIDISIQTNKINLYKQTHLLDDSGFISVSAELPRRGHSDLILTCNSLDICHSTVLITAIEFDNFFKLTNFAKTGKNLYNKDFIHYAQQNKMFVEEQDYNNCLFFTGSLIYTVTTPITNMILDSYNIKFKDI